eukprot:7349296-Prymnesium_polylepis.2
MGTRRQRVCINRKGTHAFVWTGADTINPKQRLAAFACDGLGPRLQSLPFQRCRIQQGLWSRHACSVNIMEQDCSRNLEP